MREGSEIDKEHEDCCGDGSCGIGVNPVTKAELLESVQKSESTEQKLGCKFHPGMDA